MAWAREESSGQNQAIFWKAELTELWVESMEDVMESRCCVCRGCSRIVGEVVRNG